MPFVTVAAVHQNDSPTLMQVSGFVQADRKSSSLTLSSNMFFGNRETRKKMSKSPEKKEIRLDSGKATDISETSTTDDYATAYDNSGTDTSSKRSVGHQQIESKPESKEGSSFESASSIHSFAKEDTIQIVPSSPPTIAEENAEEMIEGGKLHEVKVIETKDLEGKMHTDEKEELSGDVESSSSGSYSLDSGQRDQKMEWSDQDKAKKKKEFKLDLSDNSNDLENWNNEKEEMEKTETSPRSQLQIKTKFISSSTKKTQQVRHGVASQKNN